MEITEELLAKGFRACRESHIKSVDVAAVGMGMCSSSLTKRETGVYSIKLIELMRLAKAANSHPMLLLWEILEECDRSFWDDVATKMNCEPGIAKRRLTNEAERRGLEVWQLWLKVERSQVKL